MKYTALIGDPTDHSVSHILYAELARYAQIPDSYQHLRLNVGKGNLAKSIEAFVTLQFTGLSVTLPHKISVIDLLDEIDPIAQQLGAVNTVHLGSKRTGYNTDWVGIVESIQAFGGDREYKSAIIFGTGGAARAAIYACKSLGVSEINVFYRLTESENTLSLLDRCEELNIFMHPYSEISAYIKDAQLIINASSAGMVGMQPLPLNLKSIENVPLSDKVFLDAVFNPLQTPLLRHFRNEDATVIDGLWMMIYQGVRALEIWFDRKIEVEFTELKRIHTILEKELQKHV